MLEKIKNTIEWMKHWKEHTLDFSVNFLSWIYDFLSNFILHTPTWLFSNDWFIKVSIIFSVISIFFTMFLACIEGIKSIANKKHTDLKKIIKKFPLVMAIAGFSPIIFEKSLDLINLLSTTIVTSGKDQMSLGVMTIDYEGWRTIDTLSLLGLDIVMIGTLIPITLQVGRRWFDLLALGALTPIALSCSIFDEYKGYFVSWWNSVKRLSLFQLYYAVFITIIGLLIVSVHSTTGVAAFFVKMLVLVGGLWRMANPPMIVKSHLDSSSDITDVFKQTYDALTFKNVKGYIKKLQLPKPKKK